MLLFPGVYLAAFVFGGVFLAFSLLAGGDDADADHGDGFGHGDADFGHADAFHGDADHGDAGGDAAGGDLHHHGDAHELWDPAHAHAPGKAVLAAMPSISWFPLKSMRFWVFALTFFGLSGLLLEGMGLTEPTTAALVSIAFGYFIGAGAVNLLRMARRADVSTVVSPDELVGKVATVLLPVGASSTGKIRVSTRTGMEDFLARPRDPASSFGVQQRVLIDGFEGHRAIISAIADEG